MYVVFGIVVRQMLIYIIYTQSKIVLLLNAIIFVNV